ncbi:MAG: phytoene/squalene synthase family protein [Spirochaetota bacterium]
MNVKKVQKDVFRKGSRTYFNTSVFFPPAIRKDVYALYAFVRVADDFVDSEPQDREGFYEFRRKYERGIATASPSGDPIIDAFVTLAIKRDFDPAWTTAFLRSMELDLTKRLYRTVEETLEYVYGSAEVIGLYMARVLGLPEEAMSAACMQGRAMQFINFIRDINEDNDFGRQYLPAEETSLRDLSERNARDNEQEFTRFVRAQVTRYREWQRQAEAGYRFIPRRYLIPVKTASDMYDWTAQRIDENPFIVFKRKVKPTRPRIYRTVFANTLFA